MRKSASIRQTDIRSMLRLMGELGELPPDPAGRAVFLMDRLCKLVDAQWGIFSLMSNFQPGGDVVMHQSVQGGALDDGLASRFFQYVNDQYATDPMLASMTAMQPGKLVRSRPQMVDDRTWYNSAHYAEFRRKAHLDESIYAFYPVDRIGNAIGFGLTRPHGAARFNERERKTVDLLNDGLAWFYSTYHDASMSPAYPDLPLALQRTLQFLLQGASEKQIATWTNRSRHTIHDHVKGIYRRFQVCSRPELLAKLLRSNADRGSNLDSRHRASDQPT